MKICKKHKKYKAIYPPTCSCFECWVEYIDKKMGEKHGVFNHHEMLSYHKSVMDKILQLEKLIFDLYESDSHS